MHKTSLNNNHLFYPPKNNQSCAKTGGTAMAEPAAKRARKRERYNEGYYGFDITGPIFSCEFNCLSKEFLPKFIVSMQSLTMVKLICKIDSRSDYRPVLEALQASPLMAQVNSSVKETAWAWTSRYIYMGSPEVIKPLFHFINDRLYSNAYLIVDDCECTPLEIFERLWKQAYEYCLTVLPKSEEPEITSTLSLVTPMSYAVQDGNFNLTCLGTDIPWLNLEFISEQRCELTLITEKKNDLLYSAFIAKLQNVMKSLQMQLVVKTTENLRTYTLILDVVDVQEKIGPILNQEIFAKYCSWLPGDPNPHPLIEIFYTKLEEAQVSYRESQASLIVRM